MSKWLIAFGVLLVLGVALWMTHHEGIVIAFGAGLFTGYGIKMIRERKTT
jgi:hypothetical protein